MLSQREKLLVWSYINDFSEEGAIHLGLNSAASCYLGGELGLGLLLHPLVELLKIRDGRVPKIGGATFQRAEFEVISLPIVLLLGYLLPSSRLTRVCQHQLVTYGLSRGHLIFQAEYGRESPVSVVLGYFSEDQFHGLVLPQAGPHSFILQQLIITFEVLSVAVRFKY
jgi:hypothetical protein